jgi:hypothetical protein
MFSKSYDMLKSGGPGCTPVCTNILNRCTSIMQKSDCIAAGLPTRPFPHPAALTKLIIVIRAKIELKQPILK